MQTSAWADGLEVGSRHARNLTIGYSGCCLSSLEDVWSNPELRGRGRPLSGLQSLPGEEKTPSHVSRPSEGIEIPRGDIQGIQLDMQKSTWTDVLEVGSSQKSIYWLYWMVFVIKDYTLVVDKKTHLTE
jgi:hypothetical protein